MDFSIDDNFVLEINITGEGAGTFYIKYYNKIKEIKPYEYYDNTGRIFASWDSLGAIILGEKTYIEELENDELQIITYERDKWNIIIKFLKLFNVQKQEKVLQQNDIEQSAWDKIREYIECSDIDVESKTQLLANLARFTNQEIHILIVGACGCGKSSTINALFNMDIAQVGYGVDPETQCVSEYKLDNLYLHDTPGLGESTEKDKVHMKKIKAALQETTSDGKALIDVVLVIIDGSHRDMKSSFELINKVIIPNMAEKNRILVGINRCDLALDGRGWIAELNYPDEELLERLVEKAESVKRRIEEETGVVVEPVFYSALHKYNISKLLSYLVKCTPKRKRVFYAEKVNRDENNFLRDDTVTVQNRSKTYMKDDKREIENSVGYDPQKDKNREIKRSIIYEQKKDENREKKSSIGYEPPKDMNREIKRNTIYESQKNENGEIKNNTGYGQKKAQNREMEREVDGVSPKADQYNIIDNGKENYREEYKKIMEEAMEEATEEINRGSKEKITIKFMNTLQDVKEGAKAGAEAGITIGKYIPVIGVVIGGAAGAVIGAVGGLISSLYKKNK